MIKKLLFTTLLLMPLLVKATQADAVTTTEAPMETPSSLIPLEKCDANNYLQCDTIPVHVEVPMTSVKVLDKPWGQAFITSKPLATMTNGALNINVSMSVKCKNSRRRIVVLQTTSICGYPNVTSQVDLESWILTITHDPALNIKEDGTKLILQYNDAGGSVPANGVCRADVSSKSVNNPCLEKPAENSTKKSSAPTTPVR